MQLILDFAKTLLLSHLKEDGIYVDFTMGNGFDTLFLAEHTNGDIYAFDIQQTAIENTTKLLEQHQINHVNLILDSHSNLKQYLQQPIDAGIFNLGYLPNGDKSITTRTETTLIAVQSALELLSDTGILVIVLYPGHMQGKTESLQVENFCKNLNASAYHVLKYDFINQNHPPYLIAIKKRHLKK